MTWLPIALWGGVVGMDATSFPQIMISRPLVAATVVGLLLGRPLEALEIGILLEIFSLVILPIGAARYPEAGTASVATTWAYLETVGTGPESPLLLLAVVFGLVWERVSGASVDGIRRLNDWLVADAAGRGRLTATRLEILHIGAMILDFTRAVAVVGVGALVGAFFVRWTGDLWVIGSGTVLGVLAVVSTAMLGATLQLFGGWRERRVAFALGIACGLILLLVR